MCYEKYEKIKDIYFAVLGIILFVLLVIGTMLALDSDEKQEFCEDTMQGGDERYLIKYEMDETLHSDYVKCRQGDVVNIYKYTGKTSLVMKLCNK